MEVCVDSIQSALNGTNGGAFRLELCSALNEGGLTPSVGMLEVVKELVNIPVYCMIRPRNNYDFIYNNHEIEIMKRDIYALKEKGADGFVFGCLTEKRIIDVDACLKLLEAASPMPTTFHRAFDFIIDPIIGLETIVKLGFKRILTSGQAICAEDGLSLIKELVIKANNRIVIMPGGGINEFNLKTILEETRTTEFHGTAKSVVQVAHYKLGPGGSQSSLRSSIQVPVCYVTDIENVKRLVKIAEMVTKG